MKQAMLHDFGSRDHEFIAINGRVREKLLSIAGGGDEFVCVPMQGSGTFAVEAAIGTLLPPQGKALILINGAYGKRMARICEYYKRAYDVLEWPEDTPNDTTAVDDRLAADPALTHVFGVHCETTSGILNPVERLGAICARHGRRFIIDAMSAFGAIEIDAAKTPFDALVASSNKCLEGIPGMGFVIVRRELLDRCEGNAPSLSLDLYDQWKAMEANAQWRFTPPTHCIVALEQAIREHEAEGGVEGRGARYQRNCELLVRGMRALGFETLLPDELQAPIIVTFHMPADPAFDFKAFYDSLSAKGYVIYPGKLTVADSFRIGCIGRLGEKEMAGALEAIRRTLKEMGVSRCAPAHGNSTLEQQRQSTGS
ncbi:MAG TPA: 2-aminoethylphosphonate--pyruvate transaminase [Gammaproteobacteria bacterium]|nr:2-aminoethylphosphonate--pyruvate transaminase [Gammaproteobacteria bacterium]